MTGNGDLYRKEYITTMSFRDFLINTYSWLQYDASRLAQGLRYRTPPKDGWPILLGISFPKSGTNLLRQVLAAFGKVAPYSDRSFDVFATFDSSTGAPRTAQDALHFLSRLKLGDVAAAHFHTWPEVVKEACTSRYLPYFMYRDPRDVVVSHVFYVTDRSAEHVHHKYYTEVLTNFDDRLKTSILGRPEADVDFPDIGKRFEPYMAWLDCPEVLSQRYEDYILNRQAAVGQAVDHFLKRVDNLNITRQQLIEVVEQNIIPEKSPTFRSGKTGEWQKHFKDEHKALFKQVAGDTLIRLGYEKDLNW
jgi:hypothetical protein